MNLVEGGLRHENLRVPRASRYFLAALAAVAMYGYATLKANAAPMVDGPEVCEVGGRTKGPIKILRTNAPIPAINPDPLSECPPWGETERLAPGGPTDDYLKKYYPDGPQSPKKTLWMGDILGEAASMFAKLISKSVVRR